MSAKRSKGRARLLILLVAAIIAVAAIALWPSKGNTTDKDAGTTAAAPSASPSAPSQEQLYFKGISDAVKTGNLPQQALYVSSEIRKGFVKANTPMFPKGTKLVFKTNTLVADTSTTGHITATAGGTDYLVLLLKEKDDSGKLVWHISDTEKVNN